MVLDLRRSLGVTEATLSREQKVVPPSLPPSLPLPLSACPPPLLPSAPLTVWLPACSRSSLPGAKFSRSHCGRDRLRLASSSARGRSGAG
eukprot:748716-Hanusia_phi.AAC.5